jgi:hypothetical protein
MVVRLMKRKPAFGVEPNTPHRPAVGPALVLQSLEIGASCFAPEGRSSKNATFHCAFPLCLS